MSGRGAVLWCKLQELWEIDFTPLAYGDCHKYALFHSSEKTTIKKLRPYFIVVDQWDADGRWFTFCYQPVVVFSSTLRMTAAISLRLNGLTMNSLIPVVLRFSGVII